MNHPHIMRKMEVLLLKSLGLSHGLICRIAGVSPNTMRSYFTEYIEGGIERIKEVNFYRPQSEMCAHTSSIESRFKANPLHDEVTKRWYDKATRCNKSSLNITHSFGNAAKVRWAF